MEKGKEERNKWKFLFISAITIETNKKYTVKKDTLYKSGNKSSKLQEFLCAKKERRKRINDHLKIPTQIEQNKVSLLSFSAEFLVTLRSFFVYKLHALICSLSSEKVDLCFCCNVFLFNSSLWFSLWVPATFIWCIFVILCFPCTDFGRSFFCIRPF